MARKPESTFIASVHRHLPATLHREKMANPYRSGTADCWYSGTKADLWVEYKFVVLPKRDASLIDIDISEQQRRWLIDRCSEGRNVMLTVGCKDGGVNLPLMYLSSPLTRAAFVARLQTRAALAAWILRITTGVISEPPKKRAHVRQAVPCNLLDSSNVGLDLGVNLQ